MTANPIPAWIQELPDLEWQVQLECSDLADIILKNVPADEIIFWREVGVPIGHA